MVQTGGGFHLDGRRGSDGIDGVDPTGSAVVLIVDVAAVHWEDQAQTLGHQWTQEDEEEDPHQLEP